MSTTSIRVVTYNVLSSHLARESHYPLLNPNHLAAHQRFPVVMKKLENEISTNTNTNVIFCLQELSYDWAGKLHAFFANKGYHFVTGHYGKKFNGYMGVALAWPITSLETIDVNICRLADTGSWPAPVETSALSKIVTSAISTLRKAASKTLQLVRQTEEKEDIDHWNLSENRANVMISVVLKDKQTKQEFCVSTYHMPCAYYAPMVMTLHAELAARHCQTIADGRPAIFAGDFNIKPNEPVYSFLTTGSRENLGDFDPAPKNGVSWEPQAKPMRSAYASSPHGEPNFTNHALAGDRPFIDTLDYIFISEAWNVDSVLSIPMRDESGGPFPNLDRDEPSDHILIAANLSFK